MSPQLPSLGSVHGFRFGFGQQELKYPHPGIIVAAKMGQRAGAMRCGVIALAITHAKQRLTWDAVNALPVPFDERSPMGLDAAEHWVCLFEQTVAYFPGDTKWIVGAGSTHLGQATQGFTDQVIEAWSDYRKRRT
ncbi:hypothetical protein [Neogemmobacter tilapiae]|uniref:hypothetical protein n=1 Tax=Neogemmobacter tilapiae TaxID=875041 RepID=UPI001679EF82|nr:hypothetical protein [Gemmobacter tilapiae]